MTSKIINAEISFIIEFTDCIFIDNKNKSVLTSFESEYLENIASMFYNVGYNLIHSTFYKNDKYVTCVFLKDR